MNKIYTKTGDKGTTSLMDGSRIPKYHVQVEAYGTVDEACSFIGIIVSGIKNKELRIKESLIEVQKDLFQIESLLSEKGETQFPQFIHSLKERTVVLEKEIDEMTVQLPELTNFILPGGSLISAQLHYARTLVRKTERRVVELMTTESVAEEIVKYLNRLSDYLFTMSRFVNYQEKEQDVTWSR